MPRTTDQRLHRPDNIEWLSQELREEVKFVEDPELKAEIYDWLEAVAELPGGDILDIVDHHLTSVRQADHKDGLGEYAMRRLDGNGTENFPDSCQGCDHYGTRCPVFVDPVERQRRKQLQSEVADEDMSTKQREYRRYGEDVGCHQITGALAEFVDDHQELQQRGLQLYRSADVDIGHTDEADEAARIKAQAEGGD